MTYRKILEEIFTEVQPYFGKGKVADYIPALERIDPKKFGIAIATVEGECFHFGDAQEAFSIQSISKVFTLSLVFRKHGDALWKRVGIEPSGTSFNSLVQLEYEKGIPRNPFINAGALVITDILISDEKDPKAYVLNFLKTISRNDYIHYDQVVVDSEKAHGYRNASLVNFMKSHQNIVNNVDDVLDVYFHHCSIAMSCIDLAKAMLYFSNHGILPSSGERLLTVSQAKRLNAVMMTCGFYDEAGEFAFRVGLPGKSGVGGGIVAVIPGKLSVAVWSPELNPKGNSIVGMKALELFTTKTGMSIF
ncbi:glutaminase [Chryseosolibacter indicus]|uniref:Glutaminase n=1 Tax=Chryseosolibacter indicus TaxID=2782351 RepID=A0ABS5VKV4_9BACT|nr:glutaminase [Chryseosolibacter indicus]MBT1701726.1 glutaminase [Chryseosolibacter indicus]